MSFFGTNIKKIRQVKGLSQKAFADLFDLNRGVISAYEEGRAEPKIETLLKVAHYFNLDLDDFLTRPLQVNDLASGSNIDELMFSPVKTSIINDEESQNNSQISSLQKKLANVDLIYEFTDKTSLFSHYNIGDLLFLIKSQKSENPATLLILKNGNLEYLSEVPAKIREDKEVYKIAGYLSFEKKNILSEILERIEILEKK